MIDSQVQAFAELGRLFRQMQVESFADPVTIDDPEVLADLQGLLANEAGRIDRVFDVTLDDNDTFKGKAEQRISLGRSQYLGFTVSDSELVYKLVDTSEVDDFAESDEDWLEVIEFAATKSKAGKKLNCKPGNIQCGGKCQSGSRACPSQMSPEQKKAHQSALKKARASAKTKTSEKGGALATTEKTGLSKTGSDGPTARATSSSKQAKIDQKYASAKPDEKAIDGWQRDSLKYHTSPEGLALDELITKYHTTPGGGGWDDQPDYVKAISDRKSLIQATIKREQERAEKMRSKIGDWKNYSSRTDSERAKMEKKIANPKTSEKERERLRKKLEDDRTSSEAAAQRQLERYNKTADERRKELEEEFDKVQKSKESESKEIQEKIDAGDARTIERETERILRPMESYQDPSEDEATPFATRKRQREVIREHLIEQSKREAPEDVLGIKENASVDDVKKAYRAAARKAHPDAGGSPEAFQRVNDAFNRIRQQMNFAEFLELVDFVEEIALEV